MGKEYWVKERGADWYCPLKIWYFDGKLIDCAVVTGMNFMGDPEKMHKNALVVGEFWHEEDCVRVDIFDKFNEQVYKEQTCTNE